MNLISQCFKMILNYAQDYFYSNSNNTNLLKKDAYNNDLLKKNACDINLLKDDAYYNLANARSFHNYQNLCKARNIGIKLFKLGEKKEGEKIIKWTDQIKHYTVTWIYQNEI